MTIKRASVKAKGRRAAKSGGPANQAIPVKTIKPAVKLLKNASQTIIFAQSGRCVMSCP